MSNGDEKFADYLEGKSPVSGKYAELGDIDPPADLDAAILAEAERAANTHSHSAPTRSWVIPVSVAATVMICFSLVLNILREAPSEVAIEQDVDALIPFDRYDAPASLEALSSEVRPAAPAEKKESVLQGSTVTPQSVVETSRGRMNEQDGQVGKSRDEVAVSADLATPEVRSMAMEQQESIADAAPAVSMNRLKEMDSDRLINLGQMMEVVTDYLNAEKPGIEETIVASGSPGDDRSAAREAESSAFSDLASFSSAEDAPDRPAPEQTITEEPDSLLQRIAELYAQSQNDAAAEALAEFRQVFPDHQVSRTLLERGY